MKSKCQTHFSQKYHFMNLMEKYSHILKDVVFRIESKMMNNRVEWLFPSDLALLSPGSDNSYTRLAEKIT